MKDDSSYLENHSSLKIFTAFLLEKLWTWSRTKGKLNNLVLADSTVSFSSSSYDKFRGNSLHGFIATSADNQQIFTKSFRTTEITNLFAFLLILLLVLKLLKYSQSVAFKLFYLWEHLKSVNFENHCETRVDSGEMVFVLMKSIKVSSIDI